MATKKVEPKKQTRKSSSKGPKFSKETYLKWYKDMLLMRRFEEKAGQLYIQQEFGGFCHLYIGQEAVMAGIAHACTPDDKHITAYRDHAHPIALGGDPRVLMAELYGKTTGCSGGYGGSMHFFYKDVNFMGGHAIVGGQIGVGAGIAFAEKYNDTKNVVYVSFGDGAARQGILHETFNMAMLWKLPVVFVLENNNYAMGTAVSRSSTVQDMSKIALSYEMPAKVVNGMVPEDVSEAVSEAADRARRGEGPTLLDIRTYRYKGHSLSDPQKYRTKEEVNEWIEKDPIVHVLNVIKENKWMTEKEIEEVNAWVKNEVEESVKFAKESPDHQPEDLYNHIYLQEDYPYIKENL